MKNHHAAAGEAPQSALMVRYKFPTKDPVFAKQLFVNFDSRWLIFGLQASNCKLMLGSMHNLYFWSPDPAKFGVLPSGHVLDGLQGMHGPYHIHERIRESPDRVKLEVIASIPTSDLGEVFSRINSILTELVELTEALFYLSYKLQLPQLQGICTFIKASSSNVMVPARGNARQKSGGGLLCGHMHRVVSDRVLEAASADTELFRRLMVHGLTCCDAYEHTAATSLSSFQ